MAKDVGCLTESVEPGELGLRLHIQKNVPLHVANWPNKKTVVTAAAAN